MHTPQSLSTEFVRPRLFERRWCAIVLVALIIGLHAVDADAAASGNSGAAKKRPNILVAISDDQSHPFASAYRSNPLRPATMVSTPAFDRVARSGVLFTNAFSAAPGCSPSRAALLTGRNIWQLEHSAAHDSLFSTKYVAYPDILEKAGYFVGYTAKGWSPGNWKASGRTRNPAGPLFDQHEVSTPPPAAGMKSTDYAGNFKEFLATRPPGQPFCFWYGSREPHRSFEKGSGLKHGKRLEDAVVPAFLPDTPEIRSDLLDYALEIEWFDRHLGLMLDMLEQAGELENTLVVVTSDNGMPFPRAKGNLYEYGIHMPLAVSLPAGLGGRGGRVVDDPVSLIDLAPTFLEAAGVLAPTDAPPMAGRSLMNLLTSTKQGTVDGSRRAIFSARERHSSSRYENLGYGSRAIRTREHLYIRNFRPELWPAGDPQKYEDDGKLGPMHGAYHDIDPSPSKDFLIERRDDRKIGRYFNLAVGKRPAEELFAIQTDPACLNNLAESPEHAKTRADLRQTLDDYLKKTKDPRMTGNGNVFESYPRNAEIRHFPAPTGSQ